MPPIDIERLRRSKPASGEKLDARRQPRKRQHFLKGPVPLPWLENAARLPGKSLHAGILLWYAAGLRRSTTVPLSNIAGSRFGLDRNAKYRALLWLETAGLIAVKRKLGKAPVVTILDVGGGDDRQP